MTISTMSTQDKLSNSIFSGVTSTAVQMAKWDGTERRDADEDRRCYSLTTLKHQFFTPQRFIGRRPEDRQFPILDRFETGLATLALMLLCMSILDSMFTLTLIAHGGTEVNPFMNMLLGVSVWAFTAVKMILTAIPALLLVATGNLMLFGVIRARSVLAAAVGMYAGLIVYEIALLQLI